VKLVLASQSPRRKELLSVLGIPFSVIPPAIEEIPKAGEPAETFVVRLAREKGADVGSKVTGSVVLSADTVVVIDDEILGKPVDRDEAVHMLKRLSGRKHMVYTGVCVIDQNEQQTLEGLERTDVWFSPMDESQILDYIQREDVMDKAGAYAIQGFASVYIPRIEGSYSNVMGLPMALVYKLLWRSSEGRFR
jgi:septum formation protein